MKTFPLYTLRRIKVSGEYYGAIHGSDNAIGTLCGQSLFKDHWYILTNDYSGTVTCKVCQRIINEWNKEGDIE